MEKVQCIKCGSVGYTSSPEMVKCPRCGGRHRIIDHGCVGHPECCQTKEGDQR